MSLRLMAACALGLWAASCRAQAPAAPAIPFESFVLRNGMRVLLSPDRAVPIATVAVIFPVGSREEEKGRSGFAHLFEHLMFEGSAHAPKGVFDRLLESHGAESNASTHEDFTFYYETLPANAVPLAFWLEADRLSALDISEKNMRNQISVVEEEKRLRVDNQPYDPLLWVDIASRTFSNWSNAHPTIGTFQDLDAATLADVRAFFRRHYAPDQATLAVVGDFDPAAARAWIEKYFSWIPNRGSPGPVDTAEPPQRGERRFVVRDPLAKAAGAAILWSGMPPRRSRDFYALTLLGRLLFEGKSSRLYQLLVKDKQVATAVDQPFSGGLGFPVSDWTEYKAPGLFGGFILMRSGVSAVRVQELVLEETRRIAAEGVSAGDLERVKTKFRSDWIAERQTTLGRAAALLRAAALDGDPAAANGELERFLSVSARDIRAAAAAYLTVDKVNLFDDEPVSQP